MSISAPKKTSFFVIATIVQFLLLVGVGTWVGVEKWKVHKAQKKTFKLPTVTVEAQPVKRGDFETFISAVGTLKAKDSVVIRPETSGKVASVSFQSGSNVKKGDVLFSLDDRVIRAQLAEANAKLKNAKSEWVRYKKLFKEKAIQKSKLEQSQAAYEMAKAQADMMQARLNNTVLRAPFDGIIGIRDISPGSYVREGDEIVSLENIDPIYVDFRISEIYLERVKKGQTVEVEIDGFPQNLYEATIEAIDPGVDEKGHSIRVRGILPNPMKDLRPGLFARVRLPNTTHENIMLVPETSIETEGNEEFVFVILDGVARRAPIKTGGRNGKMVEVTAGLKPGMMVITTGQLRLGEGYPVITVDEKKKLKYK